jgi:hypothetical protein
VLIAEDERIVACIGYADDWAAYRGPDSGDNYSTDEIARHGDKLGRDEAERLFRFIRDAGLEYRR